MGKVGREIVGEAVEEIIADLNKGLSAELHDAYRYLLPSKLAAGMEAPEVAEWFAKTAHDEWGHLGRTMDRAISLGGTPLSRPALAEQYTYVSYKDPPADVSDLRQMLLDSLEGERAAIRFYSELFRKTR
jgi:bacterioferritin